jgi:Polysaccharide biosynthesis/export protein
MRPLLLIAVLAVIGTAEASPLSAQSIPATDSSLVMSKRTMVTRRELEAALAEIDQSTNSGVYSPALRAAKNADAQLIRDRLVEGDLLPADEIRIDILGEAGLSGTYVVTPVRTIVLPGNYEISVRGILRSEAQDSLTKQFSKYLRSPSLTVTTNVRVSIMGAVSKTGVYQTSAASLLSATIMREAGGPAGSVIWKKSKIKRGDKVIVDGEEFELAIRNGRSLDQLNVQAGDEIEVAAKPSSGLFWRIVGGLGALTSVIYILNIL